MKRFERIFTILFLLVGTMIVTSCSDDKDEPLNNSILGEWSYVVTDDGLYGKNEVGITYTFNAHKRVNCRMWVYKNGRKTTDDTFNFTYEFNGHVLTLKDSSGDTVSYNVSINGNKLTMDGRTYIKQ